MKPLRRIALVVVGLAIACHAGHVRTAPFRVKPDSVEPGSLRGPFTGRVLDAATRSPVAGALVYATWRFERGSGLDEAAGFRERTASSDAAGDYRIAELDDLPRGAQLAEFHLVIYKRGFVAYRSDRRFNDFGPRMDFAQLGNPVLLERWRDELSHARHLRFLGGGGPVAALTGWEAAEAAAELSGERKTPVIGDDRLPTRGSGPYLVAAQLLGVDEIKAQTKFDGEFETGPLGDEPDTATYSSQHYKALGRPETFDIAVRMWRVGTGGAQQQYEELLGQLPGVEEKDEMASRSFRATEGEIRGMGFLDGPRGIVVLITCGKSQCAGVDDAAALAAKIHQKVKTLWPEPNKGTP